MLRILHLIIIDSQTLGAHRRVRRSFVLNNSNKIAGAIDKTFDMHTRVVQLRKEMRGPVTHSDGQQTDFQPRECSAMSRDCFTRQLQGPVDRLRANFCGTGFNSHSRKSVTCSNHHACCSSICYVHGQRCGCGCITKGKCPNLL